MTVKISEDIFEGFKHRIEFDEPIPPFGTRFPGKFEGILESVRQTYSGKHLNPTVLEAAASYFNQIVRGHPFENGNKRIAILLTHVFLFGHGIDFTLSWKGMYNFAVFLASATDLSAEETKRICIQIIKEFTREMD